MKNKAILKYRPADFEEFGYRTGLECNDPQRAAAICGLHLQAFEHELEPEIRRLLAEIAVARNQFSALQSNLYDRPEPIDDGRMLTHSHKIWIVFVLALLAAVACLIGNSATFYLLGLGILLAALCGIAVTSLPLVVGHLFYEWIIVASKWLQIATVLVATALTIGGMLIIGQARRDIVDRATASAQSTSYVEGMEEAKSQPAQESGSPDAPTQSTIQRNLGEGAVLLVLALDLALAFLVGLLVAMYTDHDFTAWWELRKLSDLIDAREERIAELKAGVEMAKRRCLAGILRAQNVRSRRYPPYHKALTLVLIAFFMLARPTQAQEIERYEGILIDKSRSISHHGDNQQFRQYLMATKQLLLTEPPNTRVFVSSISSDSFGGEKDILIGWTPESRGVLTDNLNRSRRQLLTAFLKRSQEMVPSSSETDIFGALWRVKASFESDRPASEKSSISRTIWIFSDMMNDTPEFSMPKLLKLGPQKMLEHAKAKGLLVPLPGYEVYVSGASTQHLTPQKWMTARVFWRLYFAAAGARLFVYDSDSRATVRTLSR